MIGAGCYTCCKTDLEGAGCCRVEVVVFHDLAEMEAVEVWLDKSMGSEWPYTVAR